MGAIMAVGIAVSNSILLVSFANDMRVENEKLAAAGGGAGGGADAPAAGAHDRAGDDHRHDPDGAGAGRGGRAERAARPRRHRRAGAGDGRDAVRGSGGLCEPAQEAAEQARDGTEIPGRGRGARASTRRTPQGAPPDVAAPSIRAGLSSPGCGALVLVGVRRDHARRAPQVAGAAPTRRCARRRVRRGPRVRLRRRQASPGVRHLVLQGEARPFAEVTLYAKVAGYLRDLRVDKGDRVKANQVLATVIAPELDAQYLAAEADARNKRVNAKRLTALGAERRGVGAGAGAGAGGGRRRRGDAGGAVQPARLPRDPRAVQRHRHRALRRSGHADPERRQRAERRGADRRRSPRATRCASTSTSIRRARRSCASGDVATIRVPERPGWSRAGAR